MKGVHATILTVLLFISTCAVAQEHKGKVNYKVTPRELHFADKDSTIIIDISYPVVSGELPAHVLHRINDSLYRSMVPTHSAIKARIAEYPYESEEPGYRRDTESTSFSVDFMADNYLGISEDHSVYYTGAAHGGWSSEHYHWDLETGRLLELKDFFEDGIYDAVDDAYYEEYPSDTTRSSFIARKADLQFSFHYSSCSGCEEIPDGDEIMEIYVEPYSSTGGGNNGYIPMYLYLTKKAIAPYVKKKWREVILKPT